MKETNKRKYPIKCRLLVAYPCTTYTNGAFNLFIWYNIYIMCTMKYSLYEFIRYIYNGCYFAEKNHTHISILWFWLKHNCDFASVIPFELIKNYFIVHIIWIVLYRISKVYQITVIIEQNAASDRRAKEWVDIKPINVWKLPSFMGSFAQTYHYLNQNDL